MKIRTRLTLWYSGILFVALVVMGSLSYVELAVHRDRGRNPDRDESPRTLESDRDIVRRGPRGDSGDDILGIVFFCGVPAAALALVGGWWLMRKSLAPVEAVTEAAERINESNLSERIKRTGNGDELDRLTDVFNGMVSRLDESFQKVRDFTLHASHELKTPLTVMHGEMETALTDPSLPAAQRDRLLSHLDEIQRLTRIVEGLTLLTKADSGQFQLQREAIDLDDLVRECLEDTRVLAQPDAIKVRLLECQSIKVRGDRHRLRQILLNLADNAVKYNCHGGEVTISLRRHEQMAELVFSNTGLGITGEHIQRVFDRFYRGDTAHGRLEESCGLGLSITQWIVHAHGGNIQISSEPGVQTKVITRLPIQ